MKIVRILIFVIIGSSQMLFGQNCIEFQVCDDGNLCTVDDRCIDGECIGIQMDCDDGDPCTINFCNPLTGCYFEPIICEDNDPCTLNVCEDGNCVFILHGCPCDDGDPCTENDVYINGTCIGIPKVCDDGNPCTDDMCVNGECVFIDNTNSCDDGDPCTINDQCIDGECIGTPMDCDDNDPCTIDSCDPVSGCQHEYQNNVFTVTSNEDQGPGTLREMISLACDRDTIKFNAGISQININSPIAIQYDISIIGNGKHNLVINGQQQTRIFGVGVNADVKLAGFTLRNGFSSNNGGAFYNLGVVRLSHMALIDNYEGTNRKSWTSVNTVIIDEGSCEIR